MSHSSGFPSLGMADVLIAKMSFGGHPIPMSSADDFYSFLNHAGDWMDAEPREKYYYLNAGYTLLGLLLEKLTGKSLEDYLRENIWKPLGMSRTTLVKERFNQDQDRMTAYWKDPEGKVTPTVHPFHELIYAPGGILSSIVESCSYINMYLGNTKPLIDEDLLAEMVMIHTPRPDTVFGHGGYGYGWGVMEFNGETMITHTGSTGVSGANYLFIPERNIGVAYLTNMGYWGNIIPHAAAAFLMDLDPVEALPYLKKHMFYEKLSGKYTSYRDINTVEIKQQGGVLIGTQMSKFGSMTAPLIPVSDDPKETAFLIYSGEYGPMKVWFELDDDEHRFYYERWVFKKPL
jgi:CubicO group peptidase (beta-lactamase class C family)